MTRIQVLGRLTASEKDKRQISGLLLPYGQDGHTNLGKVKCSAGVIDVPVTMGRLAASLKHPARDTGSGECASFLRVWEETDGMHATWQVAKNPAGDRLLAEYESGVRTGVSVELDPVAIDAEGNIVAGRLDACAFPEKPAFDSARLHASAPEVALDEERDAEKLLADYDNQTVSTTTEEYDDPDTGEHVVVTYTRTVTETVEQDEQRSSADDTTDVLDDEGDDDVAGTALVASKREAGQPRTGGVKAPNGVKPTQEKQRSLHEMCRLMAGASQGDRRMTAALADITETGTSITRPAAWLGELWSAQPYARTVVPLLTPAKLTNLRVKGWRWVKKPVMGDYAGDKAEIPSDELEFEEYEDKAKRLAGGHDIDRAHVDFGDTEFFAAYYRAMAESYARLTDAAALAALVAAAPAVTLGPVPDDIDAGTSAVVDLFLSMIERGSMTAALVAKDVYRTMLLTPQERRLAFLSQSLGLEEGSVQSFRVIPQPKLAAGEVVGVIKGAVTFRELGETPIRADALDIAKGGTDVAVYGYYHVEVNEDGLGYADLTPTGSRSTPAA